MKTIATVWLALLTGIFAEAVVCALAVKFLSLGPCGPGNDFSGYWLRIHTPAYVLTRSFLPDGSAWGSAVIYGTTAGLFALVAFPPIALLRRLYRRGFRFGLLGLVGLVATCAVIFGLLRLAI